MNEYIEEIQNKIIRAWSNENNDLLKEIAENIEYSIYREMAPAARAIIEGELNK